MSLSKRQINYILKNKNKSAKKIASTLNIEFSEVEEILSKIPVSKPPFYFYILLVLIPILILILTEVSLRIFNYGRDYSTFVTVSENFNELNVFNPDLPIKYFGNSKFIPNVIPDFFQKEKSDSTFRVFILGGSSAAGWPFPNNVAFSRYIYRRLNFEYPKSKIEVMNLGMSAVNTYTIKDIFQDVLEQKPDLLIFYAGHNEYYGALGAGSKISFGSTPEIVSFIIGLKNYKIVQFISDVMGAVTNLFSDKNNIKPSETLMGKMIGNSSIKLNSETYHNGIHQFDVNMNYILKLATENNIPTIIGNLTNNYEMKPFVNLSDQDGKSANDYFNEGRKLLEQKNIKEARKSFKKARDLDGLRFRAPSEINDLIFNMSRRYNIPFVNIDSVFNANSKLGVAGYDLMVDHLHPNEKGYQLLGKTFYDKMIKLNYLPKTEKINWDNEKIIDYLDQNFPYTKVDSVYSDLRVRKLTGSYPFVPQGQPNRLLQQFKRVTFTDSVGQDYYTGKLSHIEAHKKIAERYFKQKKYHKYLKEMDALVNDRIFNEFNYVDIVKKLLSVKMYDELEPYLLKLHSLNPNDYTTQWIGFVALERKNFPRAIKYFEESLKYNKNNPQVYFNLAGAYYFNKNLDKAILSAQQAIKLKPNYKQAIRFYNNLVRLKKNK